MPLPPDHELVRRLLRKDEQAFNALVSHYHPQFLRLARAYVSSNALAEEVAQESWLGVLKGLSRFKGRSSLRTWLFRILTNRARTRGTVEGRSVPFSALGERDPTDTGPDPFNGRGQWAITLQGWKGHLPDRLAENAQTRHELEKAIASLPSSQRIVVTLRDVQGWSPEEVCDLLEVSEANHRVLLHRARSAIRAHIDDYMKAQIGNTAETSSATPPPGSLRPMDGNGQTP